MEQYYVRCLTAALYLLCASRVSTAQSPAGTLIESRLLLEELVLVQEKLYEIHPEPYHFISQKEFEERAGYLKSSLQPMTKEDWYVALAGIISALHDGHTALLYPNEDREKYFNQGGKLFPFRVDLDDEQRVTVRSHLLQDEPCVLQRLPQAAQDIPVLAEKTCFETGSRCDDQKYQD